MPHDSSGQIDTVMQEERLFPPSPAFAQAAHIGSLEQYEALWNEAGTDSEAFWGKLAEEELHWFTPYSTILDWQTPLAKWFVGARPTFPTTASMYTSIRTSGTKLRSSGKESLGTSATLSYAELHEQVCKFANVLRAQGIKPGDVISIYMPMVPELAIAMLACARVGAVHSVIFGGFSSEAIADRNNDASAKMQITADGGWRRGKELPLKATVDEALKKSPTVQSCIVLRRTGGEVHMVEGRDHWWDALMENASADCPAEELDSEHPLFILYTSGSTGKPKGIKHTTAGYKPLHKNDDPLGV